MKVELPRGKYILAVSGGVDSMVLLDLLSGRPGVELVVAHFNHGIRPDAIKDETLVRKAAASHGAAFEAARGNLGAAASEATARQARYHFLDEVLAKHQALKIITAHHQDDVIETAMINLLRGTGRQGLSAILSNQKIARPLLSTPKTAIVEHARRNKLVWREDSTNKDTGYLRNYLRLNVLPKLSPGQRNTIISNIDKVAKINIILDNEYATLSHNIGASSIDRQLFSNLPADVSAGYIAYLLRLGRTKDYDSKTIERISLSIKTAKPNSRQPIKQTSYLKLTAATANIVTS
jgi:tRNA(Ile)-lysidine synthase